jgi:hypothetical protein
MKKMEHPKVTFDRVDGSEKKLKEFLNVTKPGEEISVSQYIEKQIHYFLPTTLFSNNYDKNDFCQQVGKLWKEERRNFFKKTSHTGTRFSIFFIAFNDLTIKYALHRIANFVPIPEGKQEMDTKFKKTRAGLKRFIYWTFKYLIPFVYSREVLDTKTRLLHNDRNNTLVREYSDDFIYFETYDEVDSDVDTQEELSEDDGIEEDSPRQKPSQDDEYLFLLVLMVEFW